MVTFVDGTSTTELNTTLYRAQTTTVTADATDLGGTDVASSSFVIDPGIASGLSFYVQPPSTWPTNSEFDPQPQVAVADVYGNPCTGSSVLITITASADGEVYDENINGTLSGDDLSVATDPATGIAVFSGMKYDYPEAIWLMASELSSADYFLFCYSPLYFK